MKDPKQLISEKRQDKHISERAKRALGEYGTLIEGLMLTYAKQFQPIPIPDNWVGGEVIAIGYQGECLIGYLGNKQDNGTWHCESDNEVLEECTHYMNLPIL